MASAKISPDIVKMKKEEIASILESKFQELLNWLEEHPDELFEVSKREGKWTTGQHVDHLIKSVNPINKALQLPKLVLKTTFGTKDDREEQPLELIKSTYKAKLAAGGAASGQFIPKEIQNSQKQDLIKRLNKEQQKLIELANKWTETNLSKYLLPHPLLGKMTIREILLFTHIHTEHHLDALKEFY